jgi:hypothetical protein
MKTSDVLNKAADLIEERGWLQGIHGLGTDRGLCMEGGILAALGRSRDDCAFRGSQYGGRCPVYNAVMEHLGRADYTEKPLWRWNDAEERTADEVIATLRAVAVIESAREEAAEPVAHTVPA